MTSPQRNYRSLSEANPFRESNEENVFETIQEQEDTPRNSGIMIHMVPETNKSRWNHIEDLDSFFTRMYNYHQKHGFTVIVMDEVFQLFEFGFVVWLITFTIHCINHPVLFGTESTGENRSRVYLSDVVIPTQQCVKNFGLNTYLILFLATFYFTIRLIRAIYHITQYSDIKKFYNSALHIEDVDLDNTTWHEIKKKVREVQSEQHMCIDKEQLTELDIYHRILRFKNYMVALMNKNLLPVRFNVPIFGEIVSLSRGMLFNIDFILFRGPGSPFQNNWQLRDDYSIRSNQVELAQRLSKLIVWVAIANFILAPAIFLWQIIYFSFAYANILRKEPSALGMRTWSNYGRLHLRHFNELDHELDARLNRAYEYADRYLGSFSSPIMSVIAKNVLFISGGLWILLVALGVYQEFVFQIEHVLTIITVLSVIGLVCRALIPDENLIWCPEQLMTAILAHVHYLPTDWKDQSHTLRVRQEFGNLFQFKANYLLNEICSPLLTPLILIFVFRPKALEIVKFFRSFTVSVKGVGNVCSFAQMDVRKYGNPEWQLQYSAPGTLPPMNTEEGERKRYPVENGKTELSLIRFTLLNPEWQMPKEAKTFINELHEKACEDILKAKEENCTGDTNPMTDSLLSFGTMKNEYSAIATSVFSAYNIHHGMLGSCLNVSNAGKKGTDQFTLFNDMSLPINESSMDAEIPRTSQSIVMSKSTMLENMRKMRVSKTEGRLEGPSDTLIYKLFGIDSKLMRNPTDLTVADMCLSTLYLHELHKRNQKSKQWKSVNIISGSSAQTSTVVTANVAEKTPLLGNVRL